MKDLKHLVDSYLKPLCATLGLQDLCSQVGGAAATWVAAGAGAVRVYLQHALVTPQFSVGPVTEWKPWFSVQDLMGYLPSAAATAPPGARLGLPQQAEIIESCWEELQGLFTDPHMPLTREWKKALASSSLR